MVSASDLTKRHRTMFWVLSGALAASLAVIALYGASHVWSALRPAALCLLVGWAAMLLSALAGFLFGIPRRVEDSANSTAGYAVNTNLEQVSDWLTKMLIGVGLIELGSLGTWFGGLSRTVGEAMGGGPGSAVAAGGVVAFFTPLGFLTGYLWTRMILPPALRAADALEETQVADQMTAVVDGTRGSASKFVTDSPESDEVVGKPDNREEITPIPAIPLPRPDDLFTLWHQVHIVLRSLAGMSTRRTRQTTEHLISVLERRGVLEQDVARALRALSDSVARVSAGATLSDSDSKAVQSRGKILLSALEMLRPVAAVAFEGHTLETLKKLAKQHGWQVSLDARLASGERVDALVEKNDRQILVEVLARRNKESLSRALDRSPGAAPLLLVLPGDQAEAPPRRLLVGKRTGPVEVLMWDDGADRFPDVVRGLLEPEG